MGPEEDRQEMWLSRMICLGVVSTFSSSKEQFSVASGESIYDSQFVGAPAFRQTKFKEFSSK